MMNFFINSSKLEALIQKEAYKLFPKSKIKLALVYTAKLALKLWREQLAVGRGGDGRKIRKYSYSYSRYKNAFIKGQRKPRYRKTEYAASAYPDYGRLYGRFLLNMSYHIVTGPDNDYYIDIYAPGKSGKVLINLKKQGRDYYFDLTASSLGRRHIEKLRKEFISRLNN